MTYNTYDFIHPLPQPLRKRFDDWAVDHPIAASRLVHGLEEFAASDAAAGTLAATTPAGDREIFLVPPRQVLATVPDAACLVRADHGAATLEIVDFVPDYGGAGEGRQWADLVTGAILFL